MAAPIEVWVTQPGRICLTDKNDWYVTVKDSHGGDLYVNDLAIGGHWVKPSIRPGVYRISAQRMQDGELFTSDWAVAFVGCTDKVCLHLYVPRPGAKEDRVPRRPVLKYEEDQKQPDVPR